MKYKRFLVKVKHFVLQHEDGVVNFLTVCMIVGGIALGMLVTGIAIQSCKDAKSSEKVDITYIDHNTILPHDTVVFKTAQEEYEFLVEANRFKREVGDKLLNAHEIIEHMTNAWNCNDSITIDDIDNYLEEQGYYQLINEVDSLLNTQL